MRYLRVLFKDTVEIADFDEQDASLYLIKSSGEEKIIVSLFCINGDRPSDKWFVELDDALLTRCGYVLPQVDNCSDINVQFMHERHCSIDLTPHHAQLFQALSNRTPTLVSQSDIKSVVSQWVQQSPEVAAIINGKPPKKQKKWI